MFRPTLGCKIFPLSAALVAALATASFSKEMAGEKVVTIPTRPEVTVKAVIWEDAGAVAPIVILLMGGGGALDLDSWDGKGNPTGNFLIRSRHRFARQGLNFVAPDVPSDVASPYAEWPLVGFRTQPEYAADMKAIVDFMRARGNRGAVFLVGTSRGSTGAAGAGALLSPDIIDGIVLSATVTWTGRSGKPSVYSAKLSAIKVPVLLAHHEDDPCFVTPFTGIPGLAKKLTAAPSVKQLYFNGGGSYQGRDCGPRTAHGFQGIEAKVVHDIAAWIKGIAAKRPLPPK